MHDLNDKVVMVTGGTGSFGRKFAEIVLRDRPPRKLIIFSRDELKQYKMRQQFPHPCMRFFVGDVRDKDRLYRAMNGVDIVIHTAALKQVPACEYNPFEAVKTNILGAANVIDAAIDSGAERAVFIGTDKAVHPVNLYGATKLVAEKLFVQANAYSSKTKFSSVRYGNVVGSRGSVVPLFLEQRQNGEVTITDERMTRFWITLEQGVHFVLGCLERMQGGEIFVPKIPSMRIIDMVEVIAPGARVKTIGIRPGEKVHEELITAEEVPRTKEFDSYYVIEPQHPYWKPHHVPGGKPIPTHFEYRSDTNTWWLTGDDLRNYLAQVEIEA